MCNEKEKTALHILCDCDILAELNSVTWKKKNFMKPSDYFKAMCDKIQSMHTFRVGLLKTCW